MDAAKTEDDATPSRKTVSGIVRCFSLYRDFGARPHPVGWVGLGLGKRRRRASSLRGAESHVAGSDVIERVELLVRRLHEQRDRSLRTFGGPVRMQVLEGRLAREDIPKPIAREEELVALLHTADAHLWGGEGAVVSTCMLGDGDREAGRHLS